MQDYHFTSNLFVSLSLKYVSCGKHVNGFFLFLVNLLVSASWLYYSAHSDLMSLLTRLGLPLRFRILFSVSRISVLLLRLYLLFCIKWILLNVMFNFFNYFKLYFCYFLESESERHSVMSDSLWLQARILEWAAVPFSRGSSQPRDQTQVSCIAGGFFSSRATRITINKIHIYIYAYSNF